MIDRTALLHKAADVIEELLNGYTNDEVLLDPTDLVQRLRSAAADPADEVAVGPAHIRDVCLLLAQDPDDPNDNGRTGWRWARFPNGDLMLGVFPQGTTYEMFEEEPRSLS